MTEEQTAAIARAIVDPQRYRIVKLLAANGESTQCSTLFKVMELAPATLSHHMRELREAGLVGEQRTGRTVQYTLRGEVLRTFLQGLERDLLPAGAPARHK